MLHAVVDDVSNEVLASLLDIVRALLWRQIFELDAHGLFIDQIVRHLQGGF